MLFSSSISKGKTWGSSLSGGGHCRVAAQSLASRLNIARSQLVRSRPRRLAKPVEPIGQDFSGATHPERKRIFSNSVASSYSLVTKGNNGGLESLSSDSSEDEEDKEAASVGFVFVAATSDWDVVFCRENRPETRGGIVVGKRAHRTASQVINHYSQLS